MIFCIVSAMLASPVPQAETDRIALSPAIVALSAEQAFITVDRLLAERRTSDAETLLGAMAHDPSLSIRSEARFRLGRLRAAAGDDLGAVTWYRLLLDEEPMAAPVRLELARTYTRLGEMTAAAREFRRAQAGRLPLDVARQVERISAALRNSAPYGVDLSIGLAPDTNINRATAARTIDAQGIVLSIDRSGRATSGIGLALGARGFSRLPMTGSSDWLVEATGNASLYLSGRYDDIAMTVAVGPEWHGAKVRYRPSIVAGRRYFDGDLLSNQAGFAFEGRRAIGRTSQLSVGASVLHLAYPGRRFLDGATTGLSVDVEKAITPRLYGVAGLSGSRSAARDPAYATTAGGGRLFLTRDAGRVTVFGGLSYQHLVADGIFALFQKRRRDDFVEGQIGISARLLAVRGLVPSARVAVSRNMSTVSLYDFTRTRLELSVSRQF